MEFAIIYLKLESDSRQKLGNGFHHNLSKLESNIRRMELRIIYWNLKVKFIDRNKDMKKFANLYKANYCRNFEMRLYACVVQALEAGRKESKEDWMEWLRRLSIELLKESPSPALRSCWALAQTYNSLAK